MEVSYLQLQLNLLQGLSLPIFHRLPANRKNSHPCRLYNGVTTLHLTFESLLGIFFLILTDIMTIIPWLFELLYNIREKVITLQLRSFGCYGKNLCGSSVGLSSMQ